MPLEWFSNTLLISLLTVILSVSLSAMVSRWIQSRGLRYEMIKDHFNDMKGSVIEPWIRITDKMSEELLRAREPPFTFDICSNHLDRGDPPTYLDITIEEFLYRDMVENHFQELEKRWHKAFEIYEKWKLLICNITEESKTTVMEEARRLNISWFDVKDYEKLLTRVVIDYPNKIGELKLEVHRENVGGETNYLVRIFNYHLPSMKSEDEALETGKQCIELFKRVASRNELMQLRSKFMEVDKQLKDQLKDMKIELYRLLHKKSLRGSCDLLKNN